PASFGWALSLLLASSPVVIALALAPGLRRRFPDRLLVPAAQARPAPADSAARRFGTLVSLMFAVGVVMGLGWSSVGRFLVPLRGTREFGLERGGVARLLALSQIVDLLALLPVGWLADRIGRLAMLSVVGAALALGAFAVGLGSYPLFVAGCVLLG